MSRLEDNFRKVEPYVPGEQPNLPDMVKLNTNENPYPPSPKVAEALQKFELDSLRLYPDPASTDLVNALAERYHVQADQVYTGVALFSVKEGIIEKKTTFHECTDVTMVSMTEKEIADYVASGDPMDKAGAYGIQGLAAIFISEIKGDYYNVVGLPISRVYHEIEQF